MIIAEDKDILLDFLVGLEPEEFLFMSTDQLPDQIGTESKRLAILKYFGRKGFIRVEEDGLDDPTSICFMVLTEAHDMKQRGGFELQEQLFDVELKKLLVEIDLLEKKLAPNYLDSLNKISGIAGAMAGIVQIIRPIK